MSEHTLLGEGLPCAGKDPGLDRYGNGVTVGPDGLGPGVTAGGGTRLVATGVGDEVGEGVPGGMTMGPGDGLNGEGDEVAAGVGAAVTIGDGDGDVPDGQRLQVAAQ